MGGQITNVLNEGLRPENLGRYAKGFVSSTAAGRRIRALYEGFDPNNLTPERLGRYVAEAAGNKAISIAEKAFLRKASKYRQNGLGQYAYRMAVANYVKKVLEGDDLGAEVNQVTGSWLKNLEYNDENTGKRGKSPLGFNQTANGRRRVYIPRVGEDVGVKVSQGIQDYIRIHEVLETQWAIKPTSEEKHELFDALILSALKSLSRTSSRAKEAYRGALSVYKARGEADPYFRGVAKFYTPLREEMLAFSLESISPNAKDAGMSRVSARHEPALEREIYKTEGLKTQN